MADPAAAATVAATWPGQSAAAKGQQRFVPAHAGAFPSRQHEPRPAHREMITLTVIATLARDGPFLRKD